MKKYLILLLIVLAAVSCRKNKTADINDKDSGITDVDTPVPDPDISDSLSDDLSDEVSDTESEVLTDTDADTAVPCLDLRYNENTIKTNFPFKDKNGKPTFCRPGCDTPTETDPQCVRNIWEWDNWSEYQVYLEAEKKNPNQELERECYPWPCKLPDMKANSTLESFNSKCDRWLAVNDFTVNMGTIWTHGMSDGVAGMSFGHSTRVMEYDPEKDEYSSLGHSYMLGFNENRYLIEIYDRDPDEYADCKRFIVSVLRKDEKYYYELIHDNENHNSFLSRTPF